ncbi:MAG: hypothetical protein M3Q79_00480 [bacterium]|nr:hypothetical protein [bacterium]
MEQYQKKAENGLAELFDKFPELPSNFKKGLVDWLPVLSLIFGALQLFFAIGFWRTAHSVNRLADWANSINETYNTGAEKVGTLGLAFWVALVAMALTGVLGILAYSGLKDRSKKRGWDLLLLAQIVSVLAGLFAAFSSYGNSIIGTLLGAVIGFYLLFQVRSFYTGHKEKVATDHTATNKTTSKE